MLQHLTPVALFVFAVATAQQAPTCVFQAANVIAMEADEVLTEQSVVVADGRITAIGPAGEFAVPSGAIAIEAEGRQLFLDQADAGYDFIKLLRGLSRAEFDAAVQTAAEAGTPVAGHVSEDVGAARALQAGQAIIDHLDGYPQYLLPPEIDRSSTDAGFYGVNGMDGSHFDAGCRVDDLGAATEPLGVMARGLWLARDALDAGLAAIADRHR